MFASFGNLKKKQLCASSKVKYMTLLMLCLLLILFVCSGVFTPIIVSYISLNGGCQASTLLIALPGSIAMTLSIFTNWSMRKKGTVRWYYVIVIALLEGSSQVMNLTGLMYAGSAIFTVVYSSVTIYTAVFARIFLGTKISWGQLVGILVVFFGLAVVSIGARADGRDVLFGIIVILFGTMVHSSTYILSEYVLVFSEDPVSAELLCTLLGFISGFFNISWQLVYTLPNFDKLVVVEIENHHGNVELILICYVVLVVCHLIHALCFFNLLGLIGSVSTGLLKCAQTTLTFIFSHFAFCSFQKSQCFSPLKGVSVIIVIIGVIIYSNYSRHHLVIIDEESFIIDNKYVPIKTEEVEEHSKKILDGKFYQLNSVESPNQNFNFINHNNNHNVTKNKKDAA
jgi:drug/metabolite transporter (DMT)-like permease